MAKVSKLPKPFQRPAIDLGGHGKAWQHVEVETLEVEDLVIERGGVKKVTISANVAIEFFSGRIEIFRLGDTVEAFTRKR